MIEVPKEIMQEEMDELFLTNFPKEFSFLKRVKGVAQRQVEMNFSLAQPKGFPFYFASDRISLIKYGISVNNPPLNTLTGRLKWGLASVGVRQCFYPHREQLRLFLPSSTNEQCSPTLVWWSIRTVDFAPTTRAILLW